MLGFFKKENKTHLALQTFNAGFMLLATHQLLTNPDAVKPELGADILVHALSLYSLRPDAGIASSLASMTSNTFRLGSVFTALTTGCSNFSLLTTSWHALSHALNVVVVLDNMYKGSTGDTHQAPRS